MKQVTLLLTLVLALCGYSSMGMEDEGADEIFLPTAVIFTNNSINLDAVNVILLGSADVGKTKFMKNLFDKSKISSIFTIYRDYIDFAPTDDAKFHIYDLAGYERPGMDLNSFVKKATIILIFDQEEQYINYLKKSKPLDIDFCQISTLSYEQNFCEFGDAKGLNDYVPVKSGLKAISADTARNLSTSLFIQLAGTLKKLSEQDSPVNTAPVARSADTAKVLGQVSILGRFLHGLSNIVKKNDDK